MARIDAHHHFWNYTPEEFDWLRGDLAPLRRDFWPTDLQPCIAEAGIEGEPSNSSIATPGKCSYSIISPSRSSNQA